MIIKTKKYQLDPKTYINLGMKQVLSNPFKTNMTAEERNMLLKKTWWFWLLVGLMFVMVPLSLAFDWGGWWAWLIGGLIVLIGGYFLFWYANFMQMTQMEQAKPLFQKVSYEIDSRQILLKLDANQGMPINWNLIKEVKKDKDHYLLVMSMAQFIHLPFRIFNSEHDLRFMDVILARKNFIAEAPKQASPVAK